MDALNKISSEPDEILIEKIKNGHRESFNILVRRYQKPAVNYIYRLSRDFSLSEDIAQQAFLIIYKKASLFQSGARFKPWFYKILTNLYYYELRREKKWPEDSLEAYSEQPGGPGLSLEETIAHGGKTPRDELDEKEKKAMVQELLESLPLKQKTVLVLSIYNELSHQEIAQALGCSIGTVKSRLYYALKNLKEKISKSGDKYAL